MTERSEALVEEAGNKFYELIKEDHVEAMALITGLFVGMAVLLAGDSEEKITIKGEEGQRNITIHKLEKGSEKIQSS